MHRGKEFILFIVAQQYFSEIWINFVEEKFIEFIETMLRLAMVKLHGV